MDTPVLVRPYDNGHTSTLGRRQHRGSQTALPPIASFTFAEILRSAGSANFQSAIDGIAEICAKNRMSLADEYASHLPPQGEITAASSATAAAGTHSRRPGMRRPLTSVPEASSSGSEGSGRSKKRRGSLFFFGLKRVEPVTPSRTMRIGSMGRTVSISTTTALSTGTQDYPGLKTAHGRPPTNNDNTAEQSQVSHPSQAASSLQEILDRRQSVDVDRNQLL